MEDKLEFYRQMRLIRRFEETALSLFSQGLLNGTVHTCIGQEAGCVGVINALDKKRDSVVSNHRGHGHFIAFTDNFEGLLDELLGRQSGVCGGIGGSQHLHQGNFYSNGIQGGIVPVAAGIALAEKIKETGGISTVFIGDGTMGEGVVYETFNIAATWKLPIMFVIENNFYAQTTPLALAHKSPLKGRPEALGVKTISVDGRNVEEVYNNAIEISSEVRTNNQPICLYMETYRLSAHSKGDDTRDPEEVKQNWADDSLIKFGIKIGDTQRKMIDDSVEKRVVAAIEKGINQPRMNYQNYKNSLIDKKLIEE